MIFFGKKCHSAENLRGFFKFRQRFFRAEKSQKVKGLSSNEIVFFSERVTRCRENSTSTIFEKPLINPKGAKKWRKRSLLRLGEQFFKTENLKIAKRVKNRKLFLENFTNFVPIFLRSEGSFLYFIRVETNWRSV